MYAIHVLRHLRVAACTGGCAWGHTCARTNDEHLPLIVTSSITQHVCVAFIFTNEQPDAPPPYCTHTNIDSPIATIDGSTEGSVQTRIDRRFCAIKLTEGSVQTQIDRGVLQEHVQAPCCTVCTRNIKQRSWKSKQQARIDSSKHGLTAASTESSKHGKNRRGLCQYIDEGKYVTHTHNHMYIYATCMT